MYMETKVGIVIHYYGKIGVAIMELSAPLAIGDTIVIKQDNEEFRQTVNSLQIEHAAVQSAKKGDTVGIKVDRKIKEGAQIYTVTG